ncbi:hypothetical protein D3C80_1090170 [compost metagenome]
MHPASCQELAHGRIDDRETSAGFLPGGQVRRGIAPGQRLGFGAKGPMPGYLWVAHQDVLVELPPEQLVDPGRDARVAAVELTEITRQCCMQALPG